MASVHEQLSKQFYQWESRGRGWKVFDKPVYPEPVFQEYLGNFLPESPDLDDGRKPTLVSALTREQLRDAARTYLRRDRYARFTLLPEGKP